jgi:hypothetical protein
MFSMTVTELNDDGDTVIVATRRRADRFARRPRGVAAFTKRSNRLAKLAARAAAKS